MVIRDLLPQKTGRTHFAHEIEATHAGKSVTLAGWVERKRLIGKLIFLILRDITGKLQITLHQKGNPELFENLQEINIESAIVVEGTVKEAKNAPNGVEIVPKQVFRVGPAKPSVPLDVTGKTPAELPTRLDWRVLDLRNPKAQAVFKIQSTLAYAMREFFQENKFIEIHTPKIVAQATEGGANVFRVEYFKRDAFLAQSPQLYKQLLLISGFERVYEIAPVFRAEQHNTIRHLNEYTSVDAEISWIHNHFDVIDIHEQMLRHTFKTVTQDNSSEMKIHEAELKIPKEIPRIRYLEGVEMLHGTPEQIEVGEDLHGPAEKRLGKLVKENHDSDIFYLTDYPTEIRPFYTKVTDDNPDLTNSFDCLFQGVEVTTGGQRAHNYEELLKGLKTKKIKPQGLEFYLEPFQYGAPPHGGFGLGLERLTMTILGIDNIREVTFFPRDITRLTP
ncbi:MAG: aspartate--tRNA(Asn) ligase [Candidatus Ranarchaeia archaeon]|jgi:aspartyl-tRNA synthetase